MRNVILNHFNGHWEQFYGKYLPDIKNIGGSEFKASCPSPNHKDSNPSFCFDSVTGQYFCHGCGKKGDIFHFYSKIHGLDTKRDFPKVLKGIAGDFGIPWKQQKPKMVKVKRICFQNSNFLFGMLISYS